MPEEREASTTHPPTHPECVQCARAADGLEVGQPCDRVFTRGVRRGHQAWLPRHRLGRKAHKVEPWTGKEKREKTDQGMNGRTEPEQERWASTLMRLQLTEHTGTTVRDSLILCSSNETTGTESPTGSTVVILRYSKMTKRNFLTQSVAGKDRSALKNSK